tara:strand:- start:9099 stop:9479 length:381 start_codon:yes stop_codon:yes gene_type:complete
MWRRLVCIFLLVAIAYTQSSKMIVYFSFKINQDYIAKELCENREIPKMKCNGKCYLAKKLQEQEQEEKEKAPLEQRIKLDVLFYSKGSISSIPALHQHEPKTCFVKTNSELLIGFLTKPLQPPQFA